MPLILTEAEAGAGGSELETSLVYRVSSKTARDIQRDPVTKGEEKNPFLSQVWWNMQDLGAGTEKGCHQLKGRQDYIKKP